MTIPNNVTAIRARLSDSKAFAQDNVPTLLQLPRDQWHDELRRDRRYLSADVAWAILAEADRVVDDRPRKSIPLYDLAVHVAEEIAAHAPVPSHELRVAAWKDLAWALRRVGDYDEAAAALDRAEAIVPLCADVDKMAGAVTLARAILHRCRQDTDAALRLVRVARSLSQLAGDVQRVDMSIEEEANILMTRGDGTGALRLLKRLVARARDDQKRSAGIYANVALAFEQAGALKAARKYLQKAADLDRRRGATNMLLRHEWALGRVLAKEGRIPDALEALERASTGFRETENVDSAVLVDLFRCELEIENNSASAATYTRLRGVAAYSIDKRLPASQCKALLYLQTLGTALGVTQIRYVREFITDLRNHPHRDFIPPEVAA